VGLVALAMALIDAEVTFTKETDWMISVSLE
jgi:hypothetical protein